MTRLSVNINKIATLRNARGGNMPDVAKAASDCEKFGAQGRNRVRAMSVEFVYETLLELLQNSMLQ